MSSLIQSTSIHNPGLREKGSIMDSFIELDQKLRTSINNPLKIIIYQ